MIFHEIALKDAYVIEPEPFQDSRGMFARIFCKNELSAINHSKEIVQVNHSINMKRGAVRGIHFQKPPKAEIKFVKCIKGSVYDVIIDLRRNSPTFLKWHGEDLTEKNMLMLFIPEGFAHGFQTIEPESELLYFHTEFYEPRFESGIRHDDPLIGVTWPLEVTEISKRDLEHPLLNDDFTGIEL